MNLLSYRPKMSSPFTFPLQLCEGTCFLTLSVLRTPVYIFSKRGRRFHLLVSVPSSVIAREVRDFPTHSVVAPIACKCHCTLSVLSVSLAWWCLSSEYLPRARTGWKAQRVSEWKNEWKSRATQGRVYCKQNEGSSCSRFPRTAPAWCETVTLRIHAHQHVPTSVTQVPMMFNTRLRTLYGEMSFGGIYLQKIVELDTGEFYGEKIKRTIIQVSSRSDITLQQLLLSALWRSNTH